MHKQFLAGKRIARLFVSMDERFYHESNASLVARLSWKYRVNPAQLLSKVILRKKHTKSDLKYGVASICNSLTDKSLLVQERLYELTGNDRSSGNYTYLRGVLDHGAHGLLSREKKWCRRCYEERRSREINSDETAIFDDLYWSFAQSEYCIEHACTLSTKCGHCFRKQPYVSYKVEPGYCHYCRGFLGKAPSIEVGEDVEDLQAFETELFRHDVFLPQGVSNEHLSIKVLARNLRQLTSRFGEDGELMVASACGVSASTYVDWCRAKHNLSVESVYLLVDGLDLPSVGSLFCDETEFSSSVSSCLRGQFQFRTKTHHDNVLPELVKHLANIVDGRHPPESRQAIAKRFNVSIGMLENAFAEELKRVSILYAKKLHGESIEKKGGLQHFMDNAVRRCGAKMRRFDWPHLMAELKGVNLSGYSHMELSDAREKAIERYIQSKRRDQDRDVDSLLS